MLIQILATLGSTAVIVVFLYFSLIKPIKSFFITEVTSLLVEIRDSVNRSYPGVPNLNGSSTSIKETS